MSIKSQQLSKPKLLIGEGSEEVLFFNALLTHINITDVQVEQYGGKQGLASYLKTLPLRPRYKQVISLGITRDADDSVTSAFQSICSALNRAGLPLPPNIGDNTENIPRVSIIILPDNQNQGMLEDLCLAAIKTDPVMQCIDKYFECIYNQVQKQPKNMAKARIRAWLSSQIQPDKRLGEAAKAGYLPWNSHVFNHLKEFLQAL